MIKNKLLKIKNLFFKSKNFSLKWKKYFQIYELLFSKYKNKKIIFVEIGVLDGGSLEIWKKYFGKNSRIIGIDNNPSCKKFENKNFEIYIGSQSDQNFWNSFYKKIGKIDILLDDGGHTNDQQITTIINSVSHIKDGGLIVIEDTHTSYQKHFGNPYKYSLINFAKKLIDDVNFTFPNLGKFSYSLNKMIYSIQFFESLIVLKINRELCKINRKIQNNGYRKNNEDFGFEEKIQDFKKKYIFLYKFKFSLKIERFLIKIIRRMKSYKLKKYFN